MNTTTFNQLIAHQIQDMYSAENLLIRALPIVTASCDGISLKNAFTEHLSQTKDHAQRLETIAEILGCTIQGEECAGMKGLLEEGNKVAESHEKGQLRDIALISAAQRIEHYEIAAYDFLILLLESQNKRRAIEILKTTLEEEEEASQILSDIALDYYL